MSEMEPIRRYRFGVFEADAGTGELRRQGIRVRLNAQPFQVLALLLERAGELVTREEISRALWPDGTVVDYEHGVNAAVNRIREALGDTAAGPRFVETLARRGYRFVAPVERIGAAEDDLAAGAAVAETAPAVEAENGRRGRILATPEELPKVSYPVVLTIFVLFQLMYLGFYVGALGNLAEIEELFAVLPRAGLLLDVTIVTAGTMIPVRAFVLCAALLHAPAVRGNFLKLWPFLLALDELWALAPFLLLHHINWGLALACTALLVYAPFAQRSLILMGAGGDGREASVAR